MKLSNIPTPRARGGVHSEAWLEVEIRSGSTGLPYLSLRSVKKDVPASLRRASFPNSEAKEGLVDSSQTVIVYPEQIDALVNRLLLAKTSIQRGLIHAAPNESNQL